jgi:hypothetical protein
VGEKTFLDYYMWDGVIFTAEGARVSVRMENAGILGLRCRGDARRDSLGQAFSGRVLGRAASFLSFGWFETGMYVCFYCTSRVWAENLFALKFRNTAKVTFKFNRAPIG